MLHASLQGFQSGQASPSAKKLPAGAQPAFSYLGGGGQVSVGGGWEWGGGGGSFGDLGGVSRGMGWVNWEGSVGAWDG